MYKINKFRLFSDERDKSFPSRCRISHTFIIVRDNAQGEKLLREMIGYAYKIPIMEKLFLDKLRLNQVV